MSKSIVCTSQALDVCRLNSSVLLDHLFFCLHDNDESFWS